MNLERILNSTLGTYIISLLLGLGLATLFKKSCENDRCRVFKAPSLEKLNQTFKYDNKCYKYKYNAGRCDGNKQIVDFE